MITTIQACEERLEYIKSIEKEFNAIVHIDKKRKNSYESFKDMLDIEVDDYRFHLQDDVILADNLKLYLPILIEFMNVNTIHMLALFSPWRKSFTKSYFLGKRIVPYTNYLGNLAVIFSKEFVGLMKKHVNSSREKNVDDMFINEVLMKTNTRGYVHLPMLAQHDIDIESLHGHNNTRWRVYSNLFEPNFVNTLNLK